MAPKDDAKLFRDLAKRETNPSKKARYEREAAKAEKRVQSDARRLSGEQRTERQKAADARRGARGVPKGMSDKREAGYEKMAQSKIKGGYIRVHGVKMTLEEYNKLYGTGR